MKIKLISDFVDYYDHHFCMSFQQPQAVYVRRSIQGLPRPEIFQYLEQSGYWTPINDYLPNIFQKMGRDIESILTKQIVVYLDQNKHQGIDKIKMSVQEAMQPKYFGFYASEYINSSILPISYRKLVIGKRSFLLKYRSNHEWKSNCGDVYIDVLKELECEENYSYVPIYAIDFVETNSQIHTPFSNDDLNELYAVDFNISPQLDKTGIEEIVSPKQVYKEIVDFYKYRYFS
jgi:hypothetical protein